MGEVKNIICLANSRKHSGSCIAGKEFLRRGFGAWIRPISARQSAEISEDEKCYKDGTSPRVLDIIKIQFTGPTPNLYQSENYVIDDGFYWAKTGEFQWDDLKKIVDDPAPLWENGDSTYNGQNDRVKLEIASGLKNSLMLIKPQNLIIRVATEGAEFGNPRRRVRAIFRHLSAYYNLIVTDPIAERAFRAKPNGDHTVKDAYLCVSLGEVHQDGSCYKLVAAVITKSPL